jgi:hypothetical protein
MIKEQIIEFASQSPEFSQGIDVIEERLSRVAMVPEDCLKQLFRTQLCTLKWYKRLLLMD